MALFREVVLDVWRSREVDAIALRRDIERRRDRLKERLDILTDARFIEKALDQDTYQRKRDKLLEDITLAEIELSEASIEQIDIEGILAFAESLMTDAARIWSDATAEQRLRVQPVFFPEGLQFDGERFGTAATCLAFKQLSESESEESGLASPRGRVTSRNSVLAVALDFGGAVPTAA